VALDLNDILAFVKVAEEGSFTAAARNLRLPKTTVSRKVQELEQRLGAQLLHRTTRRLSLTEAGIAYFEHCRRIPQALIEAEVAVGQLNEKPRGTLCIMSPYSIMASLVAPLIGKFRRLYPEVLVDLAVNHRALDLVNGKFDVALHCGPLPDPSIAACRLAILPNRVFGSSAYLAQHGEPGHPSELRRHFALVTRVARQSNGYAWPMSNGGVFKSYEVNPVIEADDPQVLKSAVFAGAGLMMATDLVMQQHAAEGLVRPVLRDWLGRSTELHAVFPHGFVQLPKLKAFIDLLNARLDIGSVVPSQASKGAR
jgi:DNA-binding transcriptional LysR family regulator